ncbi:MAG: hypothetical protein HN730_06340, partial [Bdellovibrionales bacterium]|nr:hypothetical protein [Bdellovibrionales bacterium]
QFDLDLTYQRSFGLSYYPFIEHYLRARIKDEPGYLTQTARIGGQWDLGRETPIWGRISYVNWAPRESRFHTHYEGSEIPTPSFNLYSRNYQQKEMGGVASIAIGKPLHFTLFSDWFPLGVRRIAPRLIYHHSRWKRSSEGERIIDDFGSAVGMELLMAHRFSFRVEIAAFKREAQLIGQAETDSYYLMFNLSGANF